jgi:hypothetical protein
MDMGGLENRADENRELFTTLLGVALPKTMPDDTLRVFLRRL